MEIEPPEHLSQERKGVMGDAFAVAVLHLIELLFLQRRLPSSRNAFPYTSTVALAAFSQVNDFARASPASLILLA